MKGAINRPGFYGDFERKTISKGTNVRSRDPWLAAEFEQRIIEHQTRIAHDLGESDDGTIHGKCAAINRTRPAIPERQRGVAPRGGDFGPGILVGDESQRDQRTGAGDE